LNSRLLRQKASWILLGIPGAAGSVIAQDYILVTTSSLAANSVAEQLTQPIERERKKWADVVKRAGIPLVD
jgi:hypothetical protein